MKTSIVIGFILLLGSAGLLWAQSVTSQSVQTTPPPPTPYAITVQDGNSRVWQRTEYEVGPSGQTVGRNHSYTELATGLNHLVNGQWVESSEQIDISADGNSALATNGQHQAYFPGDIYNGQIELVTPDGLQLYSRPVGLSYDDGTNTVIIAVLTNSFGQVLGVNQVIYTNAFAGLTADLLYTYTKAGFEQDIVLRQQPPTPESLGLNPDMAKLQVFTEFFSPPQPDIQSNTLPAQAGLSLADESLGFGQMQMIQGRAFLLGTNATDAGAMVAKQWVQANGRQFLVEEVPVNAIVDGLAALPLTAMNTGSSKHFLLASRHLKLPPQRLAKTTSKVMRLAKARMPAQGFLLDYQTINSSLTNLTFQGDMTYLISGSSTYLYGTTTIEGGAVIKYATNSAGLDCEGPVTCLTSAYRPAVLTGMDDDSIGQGVSGSTGSPVSGNYAYVYLACLNSQVDLEYLRVCYALYGLQINAGSSNILRNCQFRDNVCDVLLYANTSIENCLFYNSGSYTIYGNSGSGSAAVSILNSTVDLTPELINASGGSPTVSITNSLLVGVTNFGSSFTSVNNYTNSSDAGIFQTLGGGSHYLASSSPYRNAGTTNIDPVLLAELRQKTTWPPAMVYSNVTISTNLVFTSQVPRDTNSLLDLGYHYDPIDDVVGETTMDVNTTLNLTPGAVLGWFRISPYGGGGLWLSNGAKLIGSGTVVNPCDIVY
jgi:hypothetical protein